jgi:hypothetical protein
MQLEFKCNSQVMSHSDSSNRLSNSERVLAHRWCAQLRKRSVDRQHDDKDETKEKQGTDSIVERGGSRERRQKNTAHLRELINPAEN